jgi:O-methyltransferase involved in polyketide biosynthesis
MRDPLARATRFDAPSPTPAPSPTGPHAAADGSRISPTAHYTADVWVRAGLAAPAFATPLGAVLHAALSPLNALYARLTGLPDLDAMLLARHRAIDRLLEREIATGRAGQVLEIAAGLSGRGCRFARRFPALRYVETDLPAMAAYKRRLVAGAGLRRQNHAVRTLDALARDGRASLAAVAARFDHTRGLAVVTEGLLSYLPRDAVLDLWRRLATTLGRFPHGLYVSDLHLAGDVDGMWMAELFRRGLELFARGPVRYHFASTDETVAALRAAGFGAARLERPGDLALPDPPARRPTHLIRVLAAST